MRASDRAIVESVYASWAGHDMPAVAGCLHRDAVYTLHLPKGAWSITGDLRGKSRIVAALSDVRRHFDVLEYRPLKITHENIGITTSRAKIHYVHKATGLSYEATIRNRWRIEGDKVRHFEVFQDAAGLRAFFEMVNRMSVEA